ncbi:MAG: hypothetical protein ACLQVI_30300 [Polyangiaceae bacterium]|jgi:hypothetical protein
MNKRLRTLTFALGALAALAFAGCSGASTQVVDVAPSEGSGTTATNGSSSGGASSSGSPASNGGGSSGGSSSGSGTANGNGSGNGNGNGSSSGGNNGSSSGSSSSGGAAPSQCPTNGSQQVSGSGDSQSDATEFDTVACGTLSPGQSYWWTFELPASTSKFGIGFTGGIQIELTIDGNTLSVEPGTTLPFRTKTPYYLQITPSGTASESYVLVVSES